MYRNLDPEYLIVGFGMDPFANFHNRHHHHHHFGNLRSASARHDPHRQQMALFNNVFPSMRMSLFDHDPFGHDFGGHHTGSISSFNVSIGFV